MAKDAGGLGKTLGDVGKIAGGFLAANVIAKGFGAVTKGFGDSMRLASSFNESLSKTRVVFGDSSKVVEDFAKKAASNLGMANGTALEATSTFGNFLQAMGTGKKPATDMSMAMVTLAGDLASFNNANPEEVLLALRSGLSGEAEPMRKFGVALSETAVKLQAEKMGLVGVNGVLTEAQKVQARYAIIMAQTSMAQGDFARTSDGMANKQRILTAKMDDLKTKFGQVLLPIKMLIADGIIKLIDNLPKLKAAFDGLIPPATIASITADLLPALKDIGKFLRSEILPQLKDFGRVGMDVGMAIAQFLAPSLDTLADLWKNALQPALEAIAPIAEKIGRFMLEHKEILIALAGAILLITNPWLAVVAVLAVVLAKWDEISQTLTKTIPDAIKSVITSIQGIPIIGAIFTDTFNTIKAVVETAFKIIVNHVKFYLDTIRNAVAFWKAIFSGDWGAAWGAVRAQAGAIWKLIKGDFGALLDGFISILSSKLTALKSIGSTIANAIAEGFKAAWNAAADAVNKALPDKINLPSPIPDINLPDNPLPRLAMGGIVNKPTLALLGEAGPEAVIPLRGGMAATTGGNTYVFNFSGPILGDQHQANELAQWLLPALRGALR